MLAADTTPIPTSVNGINGRSSAVHGDSDSTEDQFRAAVEIIRSLPKNGSFRPPYSMQLTFYSYFKQATEGKCDGPRPSIFDIVGRAKYDAWHALGKMDQYTAMQNYVSEFVQTIRQLQADATPDQVREALKYAKPEHIALFRPLFEQMGAAEGLSVNDVPEDVLRALEDVEKSANRVEDSKRALPSKVERLANGHVGASAKSVTCKSSELKAENNFKDDVEHNNLKHQPWQDADGDTDDGEEYSDTFDDVNDDNGGASAAAMGFYSSSKHSTLNNNYLIPTYANVRDGGVGHEITATDGGAFQAGGGSDPNQAPPPPMAPYVGSDRAPFGTDIVYCPRPFRFLDDARRPDGTAGSAGNGGQGQQPPSSGGAPNVEFGDNHLSYAVLRLQYTMDEVVRRLDQLERTLQEQQRHERARHREARWTWLGGVQPHVIGAMLLWPLFVHFVIQLIRRRRLRVQLRLK